MRYFSEVGIQAQFDLSEVSSHFVSLVRLAMQDPVTWYVFLQRYTYFNSTAAGGAYRLASSIALSRYLFVKAGETVREEADRGLELADQLSAAVLRSELCHHTSRRTLVQAILKSAGDYARLLPAERNYLSATPGWLADLVGEFVGQYGGSPGNIVSLVRAAGFHAASELLDALEGQQLRQTVSPLSSSTLFHQYLVEHLPSTFLSAGHLGWCGILGRSSFALPPSEAIAPAVAPSNSTPTASAEGLAMLDFILEHRPESALQIQHWVLEGVASFVSLQKTLLKEIYRECLELLHGEEELATLSVAPRQVES